MDHHRAIEPAGGRPRVVAVGSYRDSLRMSGATLREALGARAHLVHVPVGAAPWAAPRTLARTLRAVRAYDAELVHVFDARYASVGRWMRRKHGMPVTVSLSPADVPIERGRPRLLGVLRPFDHAFVSDAGMHGLLRARAPGLDVSVLPPAATLLPWPAKPRLSAVARVLRGIRPGRLVVGVPWPADRRDLRWFRDAVMPLVDGGPVCLIFGAPGRRYARLLFGARGLQADFRVHTGRLDGETIAAVARCVDAFVVPSGVRGLDGSSPTELALALAMGGVPVVTCGEEDSLVLAHERNAFVVEPDERELVHTVSQVLALPAIQRHALGEEFARYTLRRWPVDAVADVYGDRFAALVGRPRIPVDLRAA
jgi:hypothetical protein